MRDPFEPIPEPRVVFDGNGVIVVAKPAGMHCAPAGEAGTLCSWLFGLLPAVGTVRGRQAGEGGLLHRLDAPTSGLVAFAADDAAFSAMTVAAKAGSFVKSYRALGAASVAGLAGSRPQLGCPSGAAAGDWTSAVRRADPTRLAAMLSGSSVSSYFRPYGPGAARVACAAPGDVRVGDGKTGKDWTRDVYLTGFGTAVERDGGVLVEAMLTRGFRHQVRAHLAWLGLPLAGDAIYGDAAGADEDLGGDASSGGGLRLRAWRLSFPDPRGGPDLVVDLDAC